MTEDVDEFLAHFGVKGMHWGVVREENPATGRVVKLAVNPDKAKAKADSVAAKTQAKQVKTEAKQAKRETIAKKYDVKAADLQKSIDELSARQFKDNFSGRSSAKTRDELVRDMQKKQSTAVKDAAAKRSGKLTSTQKKVIVGASVVAALIATKIVVDNVQSGEFNRLSMKGKGLLKGKEAAEFAKRDLLSKKMSPDLVHQVVIPGINPGYSKSAIGSKMNCRRATFAYELRRRGYDVAATKTTNGKGQTVVGLMNAVTPGEKFKSTSVPSHMTQVIKESVRRTEGKASPLLDMADNFGAGSKNKIDTASAAGIISALSKQPNGSRGELGVMWKFGGGHSMAYEIFDGVPVVFDGQTGSKLGTLEEMSKHGLDQLKSAGFTRLDNVDLNMDYLKRWAKNAK